MVAKQNTDAEKSIFINFKYNKITSKSTYKKCKVVLVLVGMAVLSYTISSNISFTHSNNTFKIRRGQLAITQ